MPVKGVLRPVAEDEEEILGGALADVLALVAAQVPGNHGHRSGGVGVAKEGEDATVDMGGDDLVAAGTEGNQLEQHGPGKRLHLILEALPKRDERGTRLSDNGAAEIRHLSG